MKKRVAAAALGAILLHLALLTGGAREAIAAIAGGGLDLRVTLSAPAPAQAESGDSPDGETDSAGGSIRGSTPTGREGSSAPAGADALVRPPSPAPAPETAPTGQDVLPTTIRGGAAIRNATELEPDVEALLARGPSLRLPREGVQVLIVHTHGSEAYTPDAENDYEPSDPFRTQDRTQSVVRVGDELAAALEARGLTVAHDREIYDWPSYTGSYSRSGAAVSAFLAEHPETAVVIDLHRDALGTDEVIYKTVAQLGSGETSSQLMLVVGTGESGLPHPDWQENLALALRLQQAAEAHAPTLARPISLVRERYNQHLAPGMLILEVGSSGNTLREALAAVDAFAETAAEVLLALVEN